MEKEEKQIDIVKLIENNPVKRLSNESQSKLLLKIKDQFTSDEQQFFIASFYCYLNYNKNDYIIDLDDIWKWLGFKEKGTAKRSLGKNFAEPEDYKVILSDENKNGEILLAPKGEQDDKTIFDPKVKNKNGEILLDFKVKQDDKTIFDPKVKNKNGEILLAFRGEQKKDKTIFAPKGENKNGEILLAPKGEQDDKTIFDPKDKNKIDETLLDPKVKQNKKDERGRKNEQILMKIETFKQFCLLAKTDKAKQIRKYYIKMEEILLETIDEETTELRRQLESKDLELENKDSEINETQILLKQKDLKIMEMLRHKATKYEKIESVYIGSDNGIRSKIGKTMNRNSRDSSYSTNNVDFEMYCVIPCNNYSLVETIIKHILKQHTLKNSNEWFNISQEKLKTILETVICIIDDSMNIEDIEILNNKFSQFHQITQIVDDAIVLPVKKLDDTIIVKDEIINKYFDVSVYKKFINDRCDVSPDVNYRESSKDLMLEFQKSLVNTQYEDKINNFYNEKLYSKRTYHFMNGFKDEFVNNMSNILNTKPVDYIYTDETLKRVYAKGFNGIRIKDKIILRIFKKEYYKNFFCENVKFTNIYEDKEKTKDLLEACVKYMRSQDILIDEEKIYGTDFHRCYGYNHFFKEEFKELFNKYFKLTEQRIRFNKPSQNAERGYYRISLKN